MTTPDEPECAYLHVPRIDGTQVPSDGGPPAAAIQEGRRVCERCGRSFPPRRSWQRYCGTKCRDARNNRRRAQAPPRVAALLATAATRVRELVALLETATSSLRDAAALLEEARALLDGRAGAGADDAANR